ncbi:transposase [Streptococcus pneumoniae]|nr:transposase [Streptococcus pneumoniae]
METVYDKAQKLNSKNFKLLIGVKKETFQLMLEHLNSAYQIQHRKGGRPRSLPMEDQLIMTLRYLRYYPTQRISIVTIYENFAIVMELLMPIQANHFS